MKIKITQKTGDYQAGIIYDVPEKEAQELIKKDIAFKVVEDVLEVTSLSDKNPVFIEGVKKVKHGNR